MVGHLTYTKNRYHHLSHSLKKLGRFVGRGNRKSIASAVAAKPRLKPEVVERLARCIRTEELIPLCSDRQDTILRLKSKPAVQLGNCMGGALRNGPNATVLCLLSSTKFKAQSERNAACSLHDG